MEHRWGVRAEIEVPIRCARMNSSLVTMAHSVNVSTSGALLQSPTGLKVLSRIEVTFELPLRPRLRLPPVSAYVVRTTDRHIGIEWHEFAPAAVIRLLQLLSVDLPVTRTQDTGVSAPRTVESQR
jgi:hypothetical protein